jgi:hypothetical protein
VCTFNSINDLQHFKNMYKALAISERFKRIFT